MRSIDEEMIERKKNPSPPPSTLVELCVKKAIDDLKYLGDVGETDINILDSILSHCTIQQLAHIEESTKGRDLSQVTNKLWKRFYQSEFSVDNVNLVIERMRENNVSFKWKMLYYAKKKKDIEDAQEKSFQRMKELYKQEDERKQKRQIKICNEVAPSNKRSFFGGYGPSTTNTKSNILKKAKTQLLKSQEVKNLKALKMNTVHRNNCLPIRKPPLMNPGKSSAASSSNHGGPTKGRRLC
ncbi:uncharacterized protein LOC124916300 [Impatiens glandulifera]|uniref:uncharacterized protein LOC124916300 n=1 Tax=Impatiens glandulifera TaxID=253017 RepID=UPI001FB0A1A4|nr:uncharacterized protein LOC124916300 [Impatiens glandulifera]